MKSPSLPSLPPPAPPPAPLPDPGDVLVKKKARRKAAGEQDSGFESTILAGGETLGG